MLNSNIQNIAKLNLDTKCCLELNVRLTNDRIPAVSMNIIPVWFLFVFSVLSVSGI